MNVIQAATGGQFPRPWHTDVMHQPLVEFTMESMEETWTIGQLKDELERFEREARAAGLTESSIRTYTDRALRFVRWLDGDFQFQGGR